MNRLSAPVLLALALLAPAAAHAAPMPALPAPASTFTAGSLQVGVYGTAGKPAIVFIPGLTCGPWEWAGEIAQLSPNYTIYALTLPGFDGAPPIDGPLFQTVSADFWTMLQHRRIRKPVIIGHSLGGTLGIMLAEQHSDELGGVISVDGLPVFPGSQQLSGAQRRQRGEQFGAMISASTTPAQFEAAEKTYVLPYMMRSASDIAVVAPLTARSDPKASAAWATQDFDLDLRPQLRTITAPVLEIAPYDASLEGRNFPNAAAKKAFYASLLAGDATARVQTIQPSRHFIMYDQPTQLDAAIKGFLQSLPGAAATGNGANLSRNGVL